jgi:hypothetical protein
MTYIKLLANGLKKHLVSPDQAHDGTTTLCGCTVARLVRWKSIAALEGDECEKCANLSFRASRHGSAGKPGTEG